VTEEVTIERVSKTQIVTLARPEARNALTVSAVRSLREAFVAAAKDEGVRCVVLTGAGGHFCAGADLRKNMEDPEMMARVDEYIDDFHGLVKAIVRCPKPTVAMIDGAAVGFGADMALACDLRVVSDRCYVQEKFVSIGLMPDGGGTFWLPRLLGTARAMQLCLLADKLEGKELLELGIAVDEVPAAKLRERTLELCARLEKGPPLAYAAIKDALYANWGDLDAALARERTGQLRLLKTADLMEGVLAFMQKREPQFQGA
jgi:2-(1,2-epoxy-1,2-dihydrophenyl)acetyl-CoA isomerase